MSPRRKSFAHLLGAAMLALASAIVASNAARAELAEIPGRWSADRANAWYADLPWLVGANFVPSSAINQLEMWQAETFDPATIDRELGWAADIGMNTMRVFLHDIPWRDDREGYFVRIDKYLEIADRHGIRTMFVLFDAVWNPVPQAGLQPRPVPGVHNSGWVQSPGKAMLSDPERQDELERYVKDVLWRYRDDDRVLAWDLFNEPDNANVGKWLGTPAQDLTPQEKHKRSCELLEKTFRWARDVAPSQPLTAGVWGPLDWFVRSARVEQLSLCNSDVISFHVYENGARTRETIAQVVAHTDRPILCTEYMARGIGSTFADVLPQFKKRRIAAYNWGLVAGKSQTIYPWNSWAQPYEAEPELWFHDVLRDDGHPYDETETTLIRNLATDFAGAGATTVRPHSALPAKDIRVGLKAHNRALFIKEGWIRDPYVVKGPDDVFYLTGTTPLQDQPREAADPYNTGLGDGSIVGWQARVWKSDDLAEWTPLGSPFTLLDGVWPKQQPRRFETTDRRDWRLWAPELHWTGERWALVHTSPSPVPSANLALTAGRGLVGPWTHPLGAEIGRRHDPSLFRDDDGTWWLIWGATEIAPLKPDFTGFAARPRSIGPTGETAKMGHEGCLLQKICGKYVLFGTGWSTGQMRKGSYNLYYAVADKPTGPYGPRKFAGRFLGHGTPFQDRKGKWWCTAFFNGNVPPISSDGVQRRDLADNAYSINEQGTTIVPLDVTVDEQGFPTIRAVDPRYATPGPDESQDFPEFQTSASHAGAQPEAQE